MQYSSSWYNDGYALDRTRHNFYNKKIAFKYAWSKYFIKIAVHARHTCDSSTLMSHVRILFVSQDIDDQLFFAV